MRRFILRVLLFFCMCIALDVILGYGFSYLRSHAKGGSTENCEYIANRSNDDIIILGSSRATHHYVPQIIEDSIGMSCYNCGEEGNGVVLAYARVKMLTDRYKPKLILYEITPVYDYEKKDPYSKYLGYLRPYYDKDGIKEIFDDFDDDFSFLKMRSQMYKNTGRLLPDLVDNIVRRDNYKGYAPLYGKIDTAKIGSEERFNMDLDSLKLEYVEKLIVLAKNKDIPIVFMISPKYGLNSDLTHYKPAIDLCEKYGVMVCNFLNDSTIAGNSELFQDLTHLNHDGAVAYTNMLVSRILCNKKIY